MKTVKCKAPKVTGPQLILGDKFTIEGHGLSARGLKVVAGRFVHNGRKAKAKTLTVFEVTTIVPPVKKGKRHE